MENNDRQLIKTSTDELVWKEVLNVDEILSMIGPEGCHELAEKLIEVANKDMQDALEEARKINTFENELWFEHPKKPFLNTVVVVELENGKLGIGQLDENYNRKCWLIQGTGKMFWRSMFENVVKWRWMTNDEMIEYYKNRTLKIIENENE